MSLMDEGPDKHRSLGTILGTHPALARLTLWQIGILALVCLIAGAIWFVASQPKEASRMARKEAFRVLGASSVWVFESDGGFYSTPAIRDGVIYAGNTDGYLYAVKASSGELMWKSRAGDSLATSPVVDLTSVYVVGVNNLDAGLVSAFDLKTGKTRWRSKIVSDVPVSLSVSEGVIYAGDGLSRLLAIDSATGRGKWSATINDEVLSSPAVSGRLVIAGSMGSNVHAVDLLSGKKRWRFVTNTVRMDGDSAPVTDGRHAYFGSANGYFYAIDLLSGKKKWRFQTGDRVNSSPALAAGTVYAFSRDGFLYGVDTDTGKERWRAPVSNPWDIVDSSPVVFGGTVYVHNGRSNLIGFDTATGEEKWRYKAAGKLVSAPLVSGGVVYFGLPNGRLYAIKAKAVTRQGAR